MNIDKRSENNFIEFLNTLSNKESIIDLMKIRDLLGIHDDDALWTVLLVLQYYKQLYSVIPQEIIKNFRLVFDEFRITADKEIMLYVEKAKDKLTDAATKAAEEVTVSTRKAYVKWVTICSLSFALFVFSFFWLGHYYGQRTGYTSGYTDALDQNAAANWASSELGVKAYTMFKNGSLSQVISCSEPGWVAKEGVCYPHSFKSTVYGWKLPE